MLEGHDQARNIDHIVKMYVSVSISSWIDYFSICFF